MTLFRFFFDVSFLNCVEARLLGRLLRRLLISHGLKVVQCIKEVLVVAVIIPVCLHHRVSDSCRRWKQLIGKIVADRTQIVIYGVAIH